MIQFHAKFKKLIPVDACHVSLSWFIKVGNNTITFLAALHGFG